MSTEIICWGDNSSGQLGPEFSPGLGVRSWRLQREVSLISCGERHTLVLTGDGSVLACGHNSHGQLGCGFDDDRTAVSRGHGIEIPGFVVTTGCGRNHSLAVSSSCGEVYSWGAKDDGQLGLLPHKWMFCDKPSVVSFLAPFAVVQVSCGDSHSVALTQGGDVFSWGSNCHGQLGHGRNVPLEYQPRSVRALSGIPVTQVSAGAAHTLALTLPGLVYCCGANDRGQLGLNRVDEKGRFNICLVPALRPLGVSAVSCGESHSAALTKDGKVYTFGKGSDGQLGNNSASDEVRPRLVDGLDGPASQIACGRRHTLVLGCSGQVWAFGNGDKGQMGSGRAEGSQSPSLVPLPWTVDRTAAVPKDLKIAAGWNSNFVFSSSEQDPELCQISGRLDKKKLQRWLSMKSGDEQAECEINLMFLSSASFVASFTKESLASPEEGAMTVDLEAAAQTFGQLLAVPWIKRMVNIFPVLHDLQMAAATLRSPEVILLLLLFPPLADKANVMKLTVPVAIAISELSEKTSDKLKCLWRSLSPALFTKQLLVLKNALVCLLQLGFQKAPGVRCVLEALQLLHQANKTGNSYKVPLSMFHVEELAIAFDPCEDVALWLLPSDAGDDRSTPAIFCQYPFVFNLICKAGVFSLCAAVSKKDLLQLMEKPVEATNPLASPRSPRELVKLYLQRVSQLSERQFSQLPERELLLLCLRQLFPRPLGQDFPLSLRQGFQLSLRQDHLVEDTFRQLRHADHDAFKGELVVVFVEDRLQSLVNAKDFFYRIFKERKESGMYMYNDSKTVAWFPPKPKVEEKDYFLLGVLCGLAVYNHHIVDLPFPLALFKKLRGIKPTVDDLTEYEPVIGRGLQCILDQYGAEKLEETATTFTIHWAGETVALDPKDPNKPVTPSNKKEFVAAYVNYVFNKSVERVFEEFKTGFYKVCDFNVVALFQPEELQKLMVGTEDYDWATFKQNTRYVGEYHPEHPNIVTFWKVFHGLTEEQKRTFLWFVTGLDRVHYLGMKSVQMTVEVLQDSADIHRPQSLICHCLLRLPIYRNSKARKQMRKWLLEALSTKKVKKSQE
ncbi:putative E3 ubiquitin-protein ligase HERC6 [Neosynchiropus ocellatus]